MKNIVLVGMPGSGKTKIGRMVAEKLSRPLIDIDELISTISGRDSAEHLAELGDEKFLDFEADIVQKISGNNLIIASSGSVPLKKEGINHLKENGILVWMDIPSNILKGRIKNRQDGDSRIVGAQTMTVDEIRAHRLNKYEENHDFRFTIEIEAPKEEVAEKLLSFLKENEIC